jgi:ABC-type sugar transport system ATPase subunit
MLNGDIICGPSLDRVIFSCDQCYYIGIRPEDIDVLISGAARNMGDRSSTNKLDGVVVVSENLGGEGYIHVSLRDGLMISLKAKKSITEKSGDDICIGFAYNRCYLFDQDEKIIFGI